VAKMAGSDHSLSPNGLTINKFAANWFLSPVDIFPNFMRFSAVNTILISTRPCLKHFA